MAKFTVITLGCSKNTVDSEIILASLIDRNHTYTNNLQESDIVIINTCGFIKPAINQSMQTVQNVINTIKENNLKTKVIVTGCLVTRQKEKLTQIFKEVNGFYDTATFNNIPYDINDIIQGKKIIKLSEYTKSIDYSYKLSKFITTGYYSYVKIAEGCNHTCSFCYIPKIRGKYKSRSIEDIYMEVKKLVNLGIKEIILVSQDTSFYGYDLYKKLALSELLEKLATIEGDFWIRMLYLYPTTLNTEAIKTIANYNKIVKYIDIPLQHASLKVLRAMRRPGHKEFYLKLLDKIRSTINNVIIRSTFIVGHPYEEEEDFKELIDFLLKAKIERAGFFKYYREKGTLSYTLPQISYKIKQKRYNEIMNIQDDILKEWSNNQINKTFKVLIESKEDGYFIGRAYFDAPEVDSYIKIKSNKSTKKIKLGNFYYVKITNYNHNTYEFEGILNE
ncbi:MAG: 30S ribosomal protein S12 methylthiotransferase RimO [bacterium]|nr:30S ribosomal protein S12 methylthiotransferase RimO [bacterium]